MKKLIIVRHGRTASNAAAVIQGRIDTPLSEAGIRQSEDLAEVLAPEKIDLIISSPLLRALKTAETINGTRGIPLVVDDNLRERAYGVFEGGPKKSYEEALASSGIPRWEYTPEGGESIPQVAVRCKKVLAVAAASAANTVLIAAHDAVNRSLIFTLLDRPFSDWLTIGQNNCCINEFIFNGDHTVASFLLNRTDHLAEYA